MRRAADFHGTASLRMVEGPSDAAVVVTERPTARRGPSRSSVVLSTVYRCIAQAVFLPQKERRLHAEDLAVVNVAIGTALRGGRPRRDGRAADARQARVAALISTIGVLTGALAGGLETRSVPRHLALFRRVP